MPECKDAQVLVLCEDRRHYPDYKPRCRAAKPGRLGRRLAADCSTVDLTPSLVMARRDWRRLCG